MEYRANKIRTNSKGQRWSKKLYLCWERIPIQWRQIMSKTEKNPTLDHGWNACATDNLPYRKTTPTRTPCSGDLDKYSVVYIESRTWNDQHIHSCYLHARLSTQLISIMRLKNFMSRPLYKIAFDIFLYISLIGDTFNGIRTNLFWNIYRNEGFRTASRAMDRI